MLIGDVRLNVIIDWQLAAGRGLAETVRLVLAGGAGLIQYRDKTGSAREQLAMLAALLPLCRAAAVPLVVNDRVDLALAAGADGVHVGQNDLTVQDARRLLGPSAIIGCSATTPTEAQQAVAAGADYLGVGPVFATPTKTDTGRPGGLALVRQVAALALPVPWFVIGGIQPDTLAAVLAAGAQRIAVVSAVMAAADPQAAAAALLARVQGGS